MGTDPRGTFVISWSQTELDGQRHPPLAALRIGAAWCWTGGAVRVDGPNGILPLGNAIGTDDGRRRAAHQVRRLVGAAAARITRIDDINPDPPLSDDGFTVTDGRRTWGLTLIAAGAGRAPLVMVLGEMPPTGTDLWVVAQTVATTPGARPRDVPGGVVCFTPGTAILTEHGPRPVEALRVGDRVQTKDDGCEEIVWRGFRRVSGARLHAMPHLAPVRLREGALDAGVPDTGLLVSPDHRMVLRGARARALFNVDEVLVAARDLIDDARIHVDRAVREVTYIHLLLPAHRIVFANAVETESFHPASAGLDDIEVEQMARMMDAVPQVAEDPRLYGDFARRVLSGSEAAILRHDLAA